jgi:dTDP-4-dehydrorhamnose reductase
MDLSRKNILVLGLTGMLGHTLFRYFINRNQYNVAGTLKTFVPSQFLGLHNIENIFSNVDANDVSAIEKVFFHFQPDVVINCIGLIKQLPLSENISQSIYINSVFPHLVSALCKKNHTKLIHFSTDCVFSGSKGFYSESDIPDGSDLYARTKILGEIADSSVITLRSSLIGHELNSKHSLLEWFLSQENSIYGYKNVIFSGLPCVEMARIVHDYVIPNNDLSGILHVSSKPISKFDLLNLISKIYEKKIHIKVDEQKKIDLSLDSNLFKNLTGYSSPEWLDLIDFMFLDWRNYYKTS